MNDIIKKLRINYNKLLMKKKDLKQTSETKANIVKECIEIVGTKFSELIYKHDGCRIVQALIKHGSMEQKTKVLEEIKEHTLNLMSHKYSLHLIQKAYYYSPTQQLKSYFRVQINSQINKLIMHQYASEVIEFVYSQTENEKDRREMVYAFYGQYFILLKGSLDAT